MSLASQPCTLLTEVAVQTAVTKLVTLSLTAEAVMELT